MIENVKMGLQEIIKEGRIETLDPEECIEDRDLAEIIRFRSDNGWEVSICLDIYSRKTEEHEWGGHEMNDELGKERLDTCLEEIRDKVNLLPIVDEVLDWDRATKYLPGQKVRIYAGEDHDPDYQIVTGTVRRSEEDPDYPDSEMDYLVDYLGFSMERSESELDVLNSALDQLAMEAE